MGAMQKPHDYDPRPENGPGHEGAEQNARREAPAAARNRAPIRDAYGQWLPKKQAAHPQPQGLVLEIASGTGEHSFWYSHDFPHFLWQPSDLDPNALASIEAWHLHAQEADQVPSAWALARGETDSAISGLLPPISLDVSQDPWAFTPLEGLPLVAITNCNMIHISPWAACQGLMRGAGQLLSPGGLLLLYGPFKRDGVHTAPSNAAFDTSLKTRNADWGVRDLADVAAEAEKNGLSLKETLTMPANNLMLVFQK